MMGLQKQRYHHDILMEEINEPGISRCERLERRAVYSIAMHSRMSIKETLRKQRQSADNSTVSKSLAKSKTNTIVRNDTSAASEKFAHLNGITYDKPPISSDSTNLNKTTNSETASVSVDGSRKVTAQMIIDNMKLIRGEK